MEENRYQKALRDVNQLLTLVKDDIDTRYHKLCAMTELEELVNKATAKKVIRRVESASYDCDDHSYGEFEYEVVVCPNCGMKLVDEAEEVDLTETEYCPFCGQHLDWENEDE